jgi:hypothetical protein
MKEDEMLAELKMIKNFLFQILEEIKEIKREVKK